MTLAIPPFSGLALVTPGTSKQDIYEASATQQHMLSTKLDMQDGRVFRYAKGGAVALVQALMGQTAVKDSKFVEIVQTGYAQVVGDTDITVLCTTGSAAGENDFSGGWLVCNKVSPAVLGDIYGILASKLQTGADTKLDLKLASPWRNAMGVTGEISLNYSKFFKTVVNAAYNQTAAVIGVPLCPVPIGYYYWAQVKGPAPLMVDTSETLEIGDMVACAVTLAVPGACGPWTHVTTGDSTYQMSRPWGTAMSIAAADEPALIDLCLE